MEPADTVAGWQNSYYYTIDFCTFAADSQWNELLDDTSYQGLSNLIKDELADCDLPSDLSGQIDLTT